MIANKNNYMTQLGFSLGLEDSLESFISSFKENGKYDFTFSEICHRADQDIVLAHDYGEDPKAIRLHKKDKVLYVVVEYFNDYNPDSLVKDLSKYQEDDDFLKDLMEDYNVTLDRLNKFMSAMLGNIYYQKNLYRSMLEREKC